MLSNYDDEKRQELDRLNRTKVKRLKKTDANINWKRKKDRRDFHRRLCSFISDWESPFPDLRDIFNHDQIEWLFIEDVNNSKVPDPDFGNVTFVDFAIKAGYIDEFVVIKSGKPVIRRVTPIHHAGRNPECTREVVDSLFKIYNKFDRNYIDEEFGLTHFQVACMSGCVEAVEKFLELGQDPNLYPMAKPDASKSVDPPLHLALERKHAKIVELLLNKGADPSLVNVNGLTPLQVVCEKADEDDDDFLELFFKVCDENHRAVQIDARDKLGDTPLHSALRKGKKKVAELLLRKGANANLATEDGYSPLHLIGKYIDDDDLPEMFFEICEENQQAVQIDVRDKSGNTPLHLALANGRNKMIEWLLRHGADPNLANKDGYTPVFLICQMNRRQHVSVLDCEEKKEMAESLLRHGADPNAADEDGSTLLHILSQRSNDINLMKMFFEICKKTGRPLQVDARDELGDTPLHTAMRHDNKKSAELLLSRGADPNSRNKNRETPLLAICGNERGSLEMAKLLFEICDELHKSVDVNARDRWYRTPLSLALIYGDEELVELLLRKGADPNATDEDGSTVLHLICRGEWDMRMAKLFFKICDELNLELDVDARDGLRRTPLNLAIKYDWCLVERLLRRGADPNATDEDGSTVLHLLCRKEYDTRTAKQFFKICDELNVELYVDARDNWRRTPLHLALTYGRVEMAEVLLRRGTDPSLATNQGSTPLHIICQKKKDHHSAKMLFDICDELNKSVDVNAQDTSYRTPLSLALMYGDEELVKLLLRRGAHLNTVDNRGLTVLHRICQRECDVEMAKLFFKICNELNLELDVDARDRLRRTPLNMAIKYDGWLVEWLLRRGADPNAADGGGSTAMHHICRGECDPRTAKLFFKICDELNLEVNFDDRGIRWTPLSPALLCGEGELVESLLIRGADPNATKEDGSTLLHILSQRSSDINLVKTFFEICDKVGRPLQVDARDNWRRTPLHLALTYDRIKMSEILIRRGADPSLATNEGSTPLHIICERKKDYDSAKMFFEICDELHKSVDVNAQDTSYRTPLSLALMYGDEELVKLLLRRGAHLNTVDDDGLTVLHLICRREYDIEMAKLLFGIADEKHQLVQVNRKDKWGRTPLQYAVANAFPEMIAILFDRGADLSSFVFPSADEFERYFEGELLRQNRDIEFELFMPLILEWLENRGYQLDRRGAFTIIRILAYMSVHAEKYWSLVDYPVNEELSRAAVERVKKYSHEPTPRRLRPYPRRHLYETINMKARPLRTQESMTRDPWISYGPPNLYTEEWINPVPWNYCAPPHLYTRSENNPEPWNFYESPNSTIRFVYRPVPSSSESRSSSESNKPPSTTSHYFDFNFWQLDSEESYEEYRGVVDELDAKRHLHETPRWRGFLLRWAAKSVAELTRRLLPESCSERIAERLENVDLLNVCVAEKFPEWRADRRTRDRYAFRRMSVSRRQVWHDRRDLEDICRYPPPWRPEAYNRYYRNKKFI